MGVSFKIKEYLDTVTLNLNQQQSMGSNLNQANVREALAKMARQHLPKFNSDLLILDDTIIDVDGYPIPLRSYLPSENFAQLAVFIHGGGGVAGSIEVYNPIAKRIAQHSNTVVIAIDYRLAPEFKYPMGLNDCKFIIENLALVLMRHHLNCNLAAITLIGDSAGAGIIVSIVSNEGFVLKNNIKTQVLIYPCLDYTLASKSVAQFAHGYLLTIAKLEFYYTSYLASSAERQKLSPLFLPLHEQMPRTLIVVNECDPLHDDGVNYAQRLKLNKSSVEILEMQGMVHPYLFLESLCELECMDTYHKISLFIHA